MAINNFLIAWPSSFENCEPTLVSILSLSRSDSPVEDVLAPMPVRARAGAHYTVLCAVQLHVLCCSLAYRSIRAGNAD